MKKFIFTLAATMLLSGAAFAQGQRGQRGQGQRLNPEEMAQRRTQQMTEKYGLTEEQSAKLLELNKTVGQRRGGNFRQGGQRPDQPRLQAPDTVSAAKKAPRTAKAKGDKKANDAKAGAQQQARPERQNAGQQRQNFEAQMNAYDEGLKSILTEDQYKAYKADMEKMRQNRPERGQRPNFNR